MNFLSFLAMSYYGVGIMMACTLAALVISIRYYRRHRNLRIFTYYIAFSFLQDMATFYALPYTHSWNLRMVMLVITALGFILFEFIVCNLFILRYIISPVRRRMIRIDCLLFFGILIFMYVGISHRILAGSYAVLESILIVPPCLLYFYELFLTVNIQPLKNQPAFWVVTGILFLHACDILLMLTFKFFGDYADAAFTLNYILYSLLFILLIRAYLCKPEKSSSMGHSPDIRSSVPHAESIQDLSY
jgi:hypothetical protein